MERQMQKTLINSFVFAESAGESIARILQENGTLKKNEYLFPAGHRMNKNGLTYAFWALLPRTVTQPPAPVMPQEIFLRSSGIRFFLKRLTAKVMRQATDGEAGSVIYFEALIR